MRNPIGIAIGLVGAGLIFLSAGCVVAAPPYYWPEPPGVVEVKPGIWVVPNWETEVFYSDGWYWTRYEGRWYRGSGRRNGWHTVEAQHVPRYVASAPPGRYVQWHPPPPAPHQISPAHPVSPAGQPRHEEHHEEHHQEHQDEHPHP